MCDLGFSIINSAREHGFTVDQRNVRPNLSTLQYLDLAMESDS